MRNDYKIYFNDDFLLLTCNRALKKNNFSKVIENDNEAARFMADASVLFDPRGDGNILITSEVPGKLMCDFLERVEVIVAGGGIVKNESGNLLMIHRRGKWDLPKGKIELKELIKDGAVREVEEETGVKVATASDVEFTTYHAYILKGKRCLKQTVWFEMTAKAGQHKLQPQTEEDIDEVCWVDNRKYESIRNECYPLIRDLADKFFEKALLC